MSLSTQDFARTGISIEGERGVWHSIANPEAVFNTNPEKAKAPDWTFTERKYCGSFRKHWPEMSEQDVWKQVQSDSPDGARNACLRYLAGGKGFYRNDVRRLIGAHLRTGVDGDYNPSFWKLHSPISPKIDLWIHEELPEILGFDTWQMNADSLSDLTSHWTNEVHAVIAEISSAKEARQVLISEYRKTISAYERSMFE